MIPSRPRQGPGIYPDRRRPSYGTRGHFHHGFHGQGFHNNFVFAFGFPFAPYYAYAPYPNYYGPYCNPYSPPYYPGSCYRYGY
jgi:hypothetical protein